MDRRSREGSKNGMWGKQHSQKTKDKISLAQKARYNAIRKALKENTSAYEATEKKIELLNAMLQDGSITTVADLNTAIDILFYSSVEDKINIIVRKKIAEYCRDKPRFKA